MKPTVFTDDQRQQLEDGYLTVNETYFRLMTLSLSFKTEHEKSREYMLHGYLRRLGTLQRCIQNLYTIYPLDRCDIPTKEECVDLAINLQAFVFNVFGCIDNLAWVWATERRLTVQAGGTLQANNVSFHNKLLRKTLTAEFRAYLDGLQQWFEYMEDFRHALAHRIPLYVPPYTVPPRNLEKHNELEIRKALAREKRDFLEIEKLNSDQVELGRFTPAMTHSHAEGSAFVYFHGQILADWNTVAEISDKFLGLL